VRSSCDAEKISSDGGDSGSKECKRACICGGVWRSSRFVGFWSLSVFIGAFLRHRASVPVNMFSNLIYFIKKFYKLCTSMRVAKIMLK
jgi:hypothetical protein